MKTIKYLLISIVVLLPGISFGQDAASEANFLEVYKIEIVLGLAVFIALLAVATMYVLLGALRTILRLKRVEMGIEEESTELIEAKEGEERASFWRKFWNRLNASVPVAKEADVATDHEYDGIRELDNRLPPWWIYGFYFTIAFAAVYLFRFFVLEMPKQEEEFQAEMLQAKQDVKTYLASLENQIDESTVQLSEAQLDLDAGKAIFEQSCAVCHASDGGGGVGPNLTDKYWLHGGDMAAIFSTIKYGVPAKGMISWEAQLSPKKMQQVASYIYMMEGKSSANPKEAQGDLFERAHKADVNPDAEVDLEEAEPVDEQNPDFVDDESALEEGECC